MTIRDIAKKSGCGISTVSRALNNHPDISKQTKEKILKVVEENKFVLNSNAKQLKQRQSYTISIVTKGIKNALFASIIEYLEHDFKNYHYEINVHYLDESQNEVLYAKNLYNERKPLGIIFLGGSRDNFEKDFKHINVPCVLITLDASNLNFENLSSVCIDDENAAYKIVNVLNENNHHNIGLIIGNTSISNPCQNRFIGCKKAFLDLGLEFNEDMYEISKFSYKDAYDAMIRLIDKKPDITAVFCMSDIMAIGAMRALEDKGKKIPEDISVIGFDGIDLASFTTPRLYTVKQDVSLLATRGIDIMIRAINGVKITEHHHVPFSITVGQSVRKRD